ncbi:hypothetical protein KEM52_000526, partial [Ascosphaera acerosa]
ILRGLSAIEQVLEFASQWGSGVAGFRVAAGNLGVPSPPPFKTFCHVYMNWQEGLFSPDPSTEDLTIVPGNSNYDILSAQNAFPYEFGLCDQPTSAYDFIQASKYETATALQPSATDFIGCGLSFALHPESSSALDYTAPSEAAISPLSGSFSDASSSFDAVLSPCDDANFNGVFGLPAGAMNGPGRKESIDTLASGWDWSASDAGSVPELTPATPEDANPATLPIGQASMGCDSPMLDASSASRVIKIETDRRFSEAGYIPPVSHSSAVATERVLSLLGCLHPVAQEHGLFAWPAQQRFQTQAFVPHQPQLSVTPSNAAVVEQSAKKRKLDATAQLCLDAEAGLSNQPQEYLNYLPVYEQHQACQNVSSGEPSQPTSHSTPLSSMPSTGTQSPQPTTTLTKRRRRLTESERKRNRVLSEKQRREELKGRLDEICSMIPGLHSNLGTKSLVLQQVADWLENLLLENKALQTYLGTLQCH